MTIDHIQMKVKIPNPSKEPQASSDGPNQDLKDMDVLCTFKMSKFGTWVYQRPVTISQ